MHSPFLFNLITMELNIIKIAYNPELSNRFQIWIRNNITASMFSQDKNETMQYQVDTIKCAMEDNLDLDERIPWIGLDHEIIESCIKQDVTYIEI